MCVREHVKHHRGARIHCSRTVSAHKYPYQHTHPCQKPKKISTAEAEAARPRPARSKWETFDDIQGHELLLLSLVCGTRTDRAVI